MTNFAIIGAAGYIAPRHFAAIKECSGKVVAVLDPSDSVGVIDSFFPDSEYFSDFEFFQDFITSCKGSPKEVDYLVVCSPNHLHAAHIKFGLRNNMNVICEKPLALTTRELFEIQKEEKKSGFKVFTILQLRLHPSVIDLKERLEKYELAPKSLELTYITSRGAWYQKSWKGKVEKSGGVSTNIGIHFFDMLFFLFGKPTSVELNFRTSNTEAGILTFNNIQVPWFLSTDRQFLPSKLLESKQTTFRSIVIDNQEFEFSSGFTELHKLSYLNILGGLGFGIDDSFEAVKIAEQIRNSNAVSNKFLQHPLVNSIL